MSETTGAPDGLPRAARALRALTSTVPWAALTLLLVSGCGSSAPSVAQPGNSVPTTSATGQSPGGSSRGSGTVRGVAPGASGFLAAIDGKTLQVQGNGTQTAVTYTSATTFSNTVTSSRSDVRVGECIQALPVRAPVTTPRPTPTSATGGMPSAQSGPLLAGSVALSSPVKGSCVRSAVGFGAGGRGPRPTPRPSRSGSSTRPTAPPGGGSTFRGGQGLAASGRVAAVNGTTITVLRELRPRTATATPATASAAVPTTVMVTTNSATTYSRTVAATSRALATGRCVSAFGTVDGTGAVLARVISIRVAQGGSCSSGFGQRGSGTPAQGGGSNG